MMKMLTTIWRAVVVPERARVRIARMMKLDPPHRSVSSVGK
jgi:hypothetical protein